MVAFGELLLRLTPLGHDRILQASSFDVRYTGAEANVAVSLSCFGLTCFVVSKVPEGELGQACVNYFRRFGVNTDHVRRGGDRMGTLYVEMAPLPRATKVIYDRAGSAFACSRPSDYDWPRILTRKEWLHFSGTAPTGGPWVASALEEGLRVAQRLGVTVSCDLNYRSKLWSTQEAGAAMRRMMPYIDVLTGCGEDAARVFDVALSSSEFDEHGLSLSGHHHLAEVLTERFGLSHVAGTRRATSSLVTSHLTGVLHCQGHNYVSRNYDLGTIVDRVGAGDAFSAGIIYGLLSGWDPQRSVEFATASSCLKHSVVGDFSLLSREEVEILSSGGHSERIER
jgi:2-dehydro-3-deoxygluconokinase